MHHPTDRITHATDFVTPVVEHWLEQEIAQWVHSMKDHPTTHRTMSERSYHGGTSRTDIRHIFSCWFVVKHSFIHLSYFSFQPVLHDWCNKGRGMCYSVCGMVHIKEPLLLIDMWRQRVSSLTIRMVLNHMSDAI